MLGSREDELERKKLEKELTKCRAQIMSESDKLSDEHIDKSLNLKNEDWYGQKLQLCERELKVSKNRLSVF